MTNERKKINKIKKDILENFKTIVWWTHCLYFF